MSWRGNDNQRLLILRDRVGSQGQSGGDRNLEAWQLFEEGLRAVITDKGAVGWDHPMRRIYY